MVTGVVPSPPRFLLSIFIAHRVHQSHCSSIFYRVLLTHALALSASQFVHKKKSQRISTSMQSAGLELTKLTYTRLDTPPVRPVPISFTGPRLKFRSSTATAVLSLPVTPNTRLSNDNLPHQSMNEPIYCANQFHLNDVRTICWVSNTG